VTGLCLVYGVGSIVELTIGVDLLEAIFGVRPGTEFHPRKIVRWGLVRCEGPYTHPIFFGTVMMLLLPWSTWLSLTLTARQRGVGLTGTFATTIAAMSSISRGPALGVLFALIMAAAAKYTKLFAGLLIAGLLTAALLVTRPQYFENAAIWFSRQSGERELAVLIDDQQQVRTSSTSRILLIQHYWRSVTNAGIIGYGMTATDTFPPNVPHVPFDEVSGKQFPVIDNSYILLTLRGGWLMCLAFVLLHVAAIFQFHTMAGKDPRLLSFGRLLIGAICGHAFVVFTVYPDFDFMFVFLWTVGISSVRLQTNDETGRGLAIRNHGSV